MEKKTGVTNLGLASNLFTLLLCKFKMQAFMLNKSKQIIKLEQIAFKVTMFDIQCINHLLTLLKFYFLEKFSYSVSMTPDWGKQNPT